jgi:serine protease inhibitor
MNWKNAVGVGILAASLLNPLAARAQDPTLVNGSNKAAWELWGLRPFGQHSACYCPVALGESLAVLEAGAYGTTAEQISRYYGLDPTEYERQWSGLFRELLYLDQPPANAIRKHRYEGPVQEARHKTRPIPQSLVQTNRLWYRAGEKLLARFKRRVRLEFKVELKAANFTNGHIAAREVNDWARAQTRARTRSTVTVDDLDARTTLLMTSVVNFDGEWAHPFDLEQTRPHPFHGNHGSPNVAMMTRSGNYLGLLQSRGEDMEDFDLLEIPYRGKRLAIDLFLPSSTNDLAQLEQSLDYQKLLGYLRRLDAQTPLPTRVSVPRFSLQCQARLGSQLQQLGLTNLFGNEADFSRMLANGKKVRVAQLLQQVNFSVDERHADHKAHKPLPPDTLETQFTASRPFFFVVRDKRTGLFLFLGRYST